MARSVWPFVATALALSALAGCAMHEHAERPAWRTQAENACLAQNLVAVSPWIQLAPEIDGPGVCGLTHPFKVMALAGGSVTFQAPQTLDCSMIPALDTWIAQVLQPAAQANYGQPVVTIKAFGSYSCRHAQSDPFAKYSEHAFGNAIDLAAFGFADGREISVLHDWHGDATARAFLRMAHGGACDIFTTVLGPGYPQHDNHFHFDLAMHGNTSRGLRHYCRPQPQKVQPAPPKRDDLPDPPPLQEDLDVAQAGTATPAVAAAQNAGSNGAGDVDADPRVNTRVAPSDEDAASDSDVASHRGIAPANAETPPDLEATSSIKTGD